MKKWMLLRLAGALLLSVFSTQTLAVLNGPATSAGSHTISWEFNNSRSDVYIVEWLPDGSGAPVATSTWGWPGSIQLTGRAPGTYTYTADWCDTSFNCTTDTLVVTVTGQPTSPPPAEVTSNLETGTLPMTMDVAANGDAVASVPLQLITGVDGFQPSLGLVYSSGRAIQRAEQRLPEDTIGYGWRLEGLSQIRRCVVDKSSSSSIGLNNNDSLCLDGMPLVRTGGSHLNVGATYRTQIESYRKITIKGTSGNLWFEVVQPDGTVLEYGNGTGSRVDFEGGTDYQWSINKATDTFNNTISYTYFHEIPKGVNYPTEIEYEGAKVEFLYRARSDAAAMTIGSAGQTQSVFLHTVKVSMDNKAVREYRLLDEVVDNKRRLNKIQQCGYDTNGSNIKCLKATDINWVNSSISQVSILMSQAVNGLGADNRFEYGTLTGSSGSFLFTERPFGNHSLPTNTQNRTIARNVATKIRRDNGLGGFHDTSYAYQGHGVQSTRHWGFLGFFAQRIKDEQSGVVTYAQYRMDYPYFGSVARIHQYNTTYGSHTETLTRTESSYNDYSKSYTGGSTRYPYADRNAAYIYESNSAIGISETESNFTFNSSGYITQIVSTARTGTGSTATGGSGVWGTVPNHAVSGLQNTTTTTTGFQNRTSSGQWLIGFVNNLTTSSTGGSTTGSILQNAEFTPHASSLKVANYTQFPSHNRLELDTTYTYDTKGRRTKTEREGVDVDRQSRENNNFDAERYPLNFTNDIGLPTTIASCDLRFGFYTSATDANSKNRSATYDHFGRVKTTTNSDGVTVTTTYENCSSVGCATVGGAVGAYRVKTSSAVTPLTYVTYDKLGRETRRQYKSFSGAYSYQDTHYDTRGRIKQQSLPFLGGSTAYYITPTYDIRNRITKVTRPDGSYTDTSYSVSGNTVVVTTTERVNTASGGFAQNQTKRSLYNILGQLVSTTDAFGTSDAATVTYVYDANGNPTTVTAPGGATSTMKYDLAGNRIELIGPNVGTITNTYTALNQVKTHKDNKNQETTYHYDTLGRLTSRVSPDGTSTWVWDSATNGKGFLASRSNSGFTETYNYNSDSKRSSTVTSLTAIGASSATNFTTSYTYDSYGRPQNTTYPGGFVVNQSYNSHGYLYRLKDNSSGATLQTFHNRDAFGNSTSETYGNGVATTRAYDPKTGLLTDINTSKSGTTFQNLDYAWRTNRTLQSRIAKPAAGINTTRTENFTYDPLNRLKQAKTLINGGWNRDLNYNYNALGNLTSKTSTKAGDVDVTNYGYGAGSAGPHAVTSATIAGVGHTLTYDANGAITKYDRSGSSLDKHIQYNSQNQPTKVVVGASLTDSNASAVDEFRYDPDGQRFTKKATWKEGSATRYEYTYYLGNTEYTTFGPGSGPAGVLGRYRIRIGTTAVRIIDVLTSGTTATTEYLHRDHLGSVEAVTDQSGNSLMLQAFEPYGQRKDSDWTSNIDSSEQQAVLNAKKSRGYTGHEHLDRTGLIHMNGRVYDPQLGRFLSPDPIVQAPGDSQSWNRYSYVFNSPLNYTDPSGYESERQYCFTYYHNSDGEHSTRNVIRSGVSRVEREFCFSYPVFGGPPDIYGPGASLGLGNEPTANQSEQAQNRLAQAEQEVFAAASLGQSAQNRDDIRSQLYDVLEGLPTYGKKESGFILYEGDNGEILTSNLITGNKFELFPEGVAIIVRDGNGYIKAGQFGIEKTSRIIEILHTHPDNSTERFSGGAGGDIWFSERFNFDISVSFKGRRRFYSPTGNVDLSRPNRIREKRGEKL